MGSKIFKIEYYLPENQLTNEQLAKLFPEWSGQKIEDKIGIRTRHISGANETALDMAEQACRKVLNCYDKEQIDFLILCTQSPDYFLPTSACLLQERLGLKTSTGAFDFNLGCSGFVYGLAISKGLISAGIATNVLLVMAETYSKHINPADKANRSIFGDAAAATIIVKSSKEKIGEFILGTDGKGKENLIVHNGGFQHIQKSGAEPKIIEGIFKSPDFLYMNGPEIFNFTIEMVPLMVKQTIEKNDLSPDLIDFYVFHQANKYMLEYLRKKSKLLPEKFFQNMTETGNTVSSTIPIALKDLIDQKLITIGNKILLAGFGVGYSWGGTIIEI